MAGLSGDHRKSWDPDWQVSKEERFSTRRKPTWRVGACKQCFRRKSNVWSLIPLTGMILALLVIQPPPVPAQPPVLSASEIDYPPFCIVDKAGRPQGFSVELMRAALAAMNREVTFRTGRWEEVRGWLERGEVQALPLVGRTPEREELFDFTFPYMALHGAIVVRQDSSGIVDIGDLRGRRVAVMKGDNAEEFLRREDRGIEIHTTGTFEEALRELSEGRHDAVVVQRLVALRLIAEAGLRNLKVIDRPIEGFRQDFSFAVREGDRETLALLNEGLAIVIADGTYRHLHSKWFASLELPSDRRIVVGGDHNYPPFEFLDKDGRPAGYTVDLTRAIALEMGLDVEIRLGPWSDIVEALESGEVDVIQGMFYSPERDLKYDFTQPHAENHYVGIVRKGEGPPPATFEDLTGKRIVVQRGDAIHDLLIDKGLGGQVSLVETQEDVLRELAEGRHDCAVAVRISSLYLLKKQGWTNLRLGTKPFASMQYCYAVPNNRKALLAQFSEGLNVLEEKGEYHRIFEKWLGVYKEEPPSLLVALRYSAIVLVPLLLIFCLGFVWSWSLRRQVADRTKELRESLDRFQYVFESANVGKSLTLPTGEINVNRTYAEYLGYAPEELIGKTWQELTPAEDVESIEQKLAPLLLGSEDSARFEKRYLRKDGSCVWGDVNVKMRRDANGRPLHFVTTIVDVTERKRNEERIEHLVQVLRALRDVNHLMLHEKDRDALLHQACAILIEARGYRSAWIGLHDGAKGIRAVAESGIGEEFGAVRAELEHGGWPKCCLQAMSSTDIVVMRDTSVSCTACPLARMYMDTAALAAKLHHAGREYGVIVVALPSAVADDEQEQSLFKELAEDIGFALYGIEAEEERTKAEKEQARLQAQLLQAQKMESVGRLAGGVAHDFNNILSVIMSYSELALYRVEPDDPVRDDLKEIFAAAVRSREITRQLLAFARKEAISPEVLDLNATVEGMLKILRRLIGEDIELAWLPKAGLWPVMMDPTQIDQVLANLCVNARDAISDVGKITIQTNVVSFDADYCSEHAGFVPGDYVLLSVSDDGCGMDRETLDRIFEPFFTTKGLGRGTGLGLATVYGIVKQNEGFINVYSEPGQGTVVRIYLPRHVGEVPEERQQTAVQSPMGRGEILLVVEDEISLLKVAEKFLTRLNYKVLTARTPSEALQMAGEHASRIALLITDVVMPEMNGRELASKIQNLCPQLKCLYMSGYTAEIIAHRGVLDKDLNFIQKPFSTQDLAAKVRAVLDG